MNQKLNELEQFKKQFPNAKYPKAYYQFAAIRIFWLKAKDSDQKEFMLSTLTDSMHEIVTIYKLEQEFLKEVA
jgi:hypothetical protein